jgi:hypothetical protein
MVADKTAFFNKRKQKLALYAFVSYNIKVVGFPGGSGNPGHKRPSAQKGRKEPAM